MNKVLYSQQHEAFTKWANERNLKMELDSTDNWPPRYVFSFTAGAWEGWQAGYSAREHDIVGLYDAIAHGDEKHRDWLKDAINKHFKNGKES